MAPHSSTLAWRIPGTGAWWTAVYGVAQSRTRLKRRSSSSSSSSSTLCPHLIKAEVVRFHLLEGRVQKLFGIFLHKHFVSSSPFIYLFSYLFIYTQTCGYLFLLSNSITNSMDMNLSKLWELVEDRGPWHAIVHEVESWIQLSD